MGKLGLAGEPLSQGILDEFDGRVQIQLFHNLPLVKLNGAGEIFKVAAMSLTVCPSANNCSTSRWRVVSSGPDGAPPSTPRNMLSTTSFVTSGVT